MGVGAIYNRVHKPFEQLISNEIIEAEHECKY